MWKQTEHGDIAATAARLIVEEAGGREEILGHQERGRLRFLATNGHIHEAYRTILRDALRGV